MNDSQQFVIVLLPGLDGTGILFNPFLRSLPPWLRPVVVAYPGNEKLGYEALLPMVLKSLPTEAPFLILGESFSGPLALMAAARTPAGLRGVVLCATFVRSPFWIRAAWLGRLVPDFVFRIYPFASAAKAMMGGYSTGELREAFRSAIRKVAPEVLAFRVREALRVDVARNLVECPVPILDLRGSRDLVVPGHNAREVAALLPAVKQVMLKSPHMVLQTRPEEAASAINGFLERLPPS